MHIIKIGILDLGKIKQEILFRFACDDFTDGHKSAGPFPITAFEFELGVFKTWTILDLSPFLALQQFLQISELDSLGRIEQKSCNPP